MRARFVVAAPDRLDKLIASQSPLSRKRARALIGRGGVKVDGQRAKHPAQVVEAGAVVEVRTGAPTVAAPDLPERYRDADLLVVDKPFGLPAQAGRSGGGDHVYGIVAADEPYAGLHHRLDTPASGLMLLTLSRRVNPAIAAAFREHAIRRSYRVVVLGDPGPEGVWDAPLDDKPAETRFVRRSSGGGMSALDVELVTGRTHQIRRHAMEAGHPVIGDRRHGGAAGRLWPRLALHAARLRLDHPVSGAPLDVSAPLPADLAALFARAGSPVEDD